MKQYKIEKAGGFNSPAFRILEVPGGFEPPYMVLQTTD